MNEVKLNSDLAGRMQKIYKEMEQSYDQVAAQLHFSCDGCPDNCCDSYFQHHTYVEWAYLWQGFRELSESEQADIIERSRKYLSICEQALSRNEQPLAMCPLNQKGRCILYTHRLMVCRTHGVPASMLRPDGQRLNFPGCFRCQEHVKKNFHHESEAPKVERTHLLRELAMLENELMGGKKHLYPRVKLTIAQMLLKGPPTIAAPHCERNKNE